MLALWEGQKDWWVITKEKPGLRWKGQIEGAEGLIYKYDKICLRTRRPTYRQVSWSQELVGGTTEPHSHVDSKITSRGSGRLLLTQKAESRQTQKA